ncbi:unnamed protein product [Pseudo-nitzschia multistriata]|uniref:Inositol polyphosphate-related phosphatase domain-containing protein n=1 Tax=Pseudo-nitzschia multistriata TaxID=183589 RepID=A0A448ZF57_9STRA|nr:unnamed protein product [Pseudo-nitzschia multistriata]
MGNEEPNEESISEWIPKSGATNLVLQNQEYPIKAKHGTSTNKMIVDETKGANEGDDNDDAKFHIIAIGMQEATFELREATKSLKGKFQKVTNAVEQVTKDQDHNSQGRPSSAKFKELISPLYDRDSSLREKEEELKSDLDGGKVQADTEFLHQMLGNHLPGYTRAVSYQRGQMRLMIFYDDDEISLDVLSVKAQNTGRAGLANKGGIVAECEIDSGTRISFLTAHLEAHEGLSKYNTRCSTIGDILKGTASSLLDSYCCDVSMTSHFMFAMGDLNFRTRLPNHAIGSDEHLKEAHKLAEMKDWDALNKYDELSFALREKECFVGFSTPRCDFPPTFKVDRKDGYSYVSKRSPSYTDRILYKANHRLAPMIDLLAYGPIDRFTTSDHKPVRGAYEIQLNQKLKSRPILTKRYKKSMALISSTSALVRKVKKLSTSKQKRAKMAKQKSNQVHSEKFHMFLSSISCEIAQDDSTSSHPPSPRVTLVSTPTDAMTSENKMNRFKVWYQKSAGRFRAQSVSKWPQTTTIGNTYCPRWDKEIAIAIQTHLDCGSPVDLTGAMLHILVHDARDFVTLIGSCTLNLASLITSSDNEKRESNSSNNTFGGYNSPSFKERLKRMSESVMKITEASLFTLSERSSKEMRGRTSSVTFSPRSSEKASSAIGLADSYAEIVPLHHVFDEALLKNGKEVGRIKFKVDTWWLNDGDFAHLPARSMR